VHRAAAALHQPADASKRCPLIRGNDSILSSPSIQHPHLALHAVQVEAADAEDVVDAHRRPLRPHDLRHAVDAPQAGLQRVRRLGADLAQAITKAGVNTLLPRGPCGMGVENQPA
jgi:hypothetical protein